MPHIQLDLTFLTHPKTITVSPLAQLLFIRSILYSAIHMTDGKIPHSAPHQLCWDMGRYDVATGGVPGQFSVGHCVEAGELVDELVGIGWYEPHDGGYRIHHYLHYQLSRRQIAAISKERSKAGKASGLARREKINGKSSEQPVEQRVEQNANKNEPIPIPITTVLKEKKESVVLCDFEVFWKEYPRKERKQDAVKAWKKLNPDAQLNVTLLNTLAYHKRSEQWQRDNGKYIPHAATWLNGRRWEDELPNGKAVTNRPPPPPPKNDPIARGLWGRQYGDPKQYGYESASHSTD